MDSMPSLAATTDLQPVPMLDFRRDYAAIRDEVLAAVTSVCDSQRFILGPEVGIFEAAAAQACNVPFAIGCASGTDALWLALAALQIDTPDQAVVTTPFSFFATVSSILRAGAKPLLADIDPFTFNLAPSAVEAVLADTPAAAVMPVHLYGQCADMTALTTLAANHNFKLIEDAAQAFGAQWQGVPAGALGDIAAFSFYPTKNLSAFGDAGLVTTRDANLAERSTMLRAHGMRKRYFHDEVGWNSRLDTLQAAVLTIKLRHLSSGNARRRELACLYHQRFAEAGLAAPLNSHDTADGIVVPFADPRAHHVFHQYVIRAPRRDALRDHLTAHSIGTEIYYPQPLHLQKSLASLGYKLGDFPVSERAAAEVLALPMYPGLRNDEVDTVVEAIRRFYA
jgi:dTDP-4-amino-4,6-dideoxygalactose transaminase